MLKQQIIDDPIMNNENLFDKAQEQSCHLAIQALFNDLKNLRESVPSATISTITLHRRLPRNEDTISYVANAIVKLHLSSHGSASF